MLKSHTKGLGILLSTVPLAGTWTLSTASY